MNCDEAAEYVSALCDGVTIPRAAAEHINACESCRRLLKEYVEVGTELRRLASLEIAEAPLPQFVGPAKRGFAAIIWQRSRKTVRIPRLAFLSLLAAVVVLGSGWARQSVKSNQSGSVLLVQAKINHGPTSFCALSAANKKHGSCAYIQKSKSGVLLWDIQALSKIGDRALIGVRAAVVPPGPLANFSHVKKLPQHQYELTPGKTLNIKVDNYVTISLSGQWSSHVPVIASGMVNQNHKLEPRPNELRIFSPLLLRGNKMIGQLEGGSATVNHNGWAAELYLKGVGRFDLSMSPIPGAVKGKVDFNRISFSVKGRSYVFVTGTPISRSHDVWVYLNPNPPAPDAKGKSYIGVTQISDLTSTTAHH